MNKHLNRRWIFGARTACASMAAIVGVMAIAPTVEAKRQPTESTVLVNNFIDDQNERFNSLDTRGDALLDRISNQLDDAVDRGQLNKVLNSERRYRNFVDQDLRSFEKSSANGERKILKVLNRRNADAALSQQVEDAVDSNISRLDAKRSELENDIAQMIDDAINDIENQVDDDDDNNNNDDDDNNNDDDNDD